MISLRRALLSLLLFPVSLANAKTELEKTSTGWQMKVDGEPYFVKGFTWSHTPVGMKYDYNLFAEEEPAIKAALERDLTLIRDAGGNTLRHVVPPQWMKFIHESYGLHFVANDYCGRYGLNIDGQFIAQTDYSDPKVRELIKTTWRDLTTEYREVPGLLCYALGNENNYGLEWVSAAVENLPEGERQTAKARHLYSLFNEIAVEIKKLDPNHPVGIVNGDLQYLQLIAELCPDIDFIGVNAYRGPTFSNLFEEVKTTLDKPIIFMETGCDAYHAVDGKEEQLSQARMAHSNWIDIYRNTASNGGSGNCVGGLHFQWADEWWKHGQEYELSTHNTSASWHHSEYSHDAAAAENMNEEWFGVCAISPKSINGAHLIRPRAAYFTLKNLWQNDPYSLTSKKLQDLTLDEKGVTEQAQVATQKLQKLEASAKTPYHQAQKLALPAVIYREGGEELAWVPSGVMPERNFLALNPSCELAPHSGKTCFEIEYTSGGDWSGLQFQHPAGDWENNSPGGFEVTGAKTLKFWAKGAQGGEVFSLNMGGPLTGIYPNTAQADFGTLTLTKEWTEHSFTLDGKDLRRIKNPFTIVLKGNGFPFTIYLDDIAFE